MYCLWRVQWPGKESTLVKLSIFCCLTPTPDLFTITIYGIQYNIYDTLYCLECSDLESTLVQLSIFCCLTPAPKPALIKYEIWIKIRQFSIQYNEQYNLHFVKSGNQIVALANKPSHFANLESFEIPRIFFKIKELRLKRFWILSLKNNPFLNSFIVYLIFPYKLVFGCLCAPPNCWSCIIAPFLSFNCH